MSLLSIQNLTVRLKNITPVEQASLVVERGKCVALIGPSGCGKTTLARSILKLQDNTVLTGKILFHQANLLDLSEKELLNIRGGKIAMIFQEPMTALNPLHPVGKQIMESLVLHKNNPTKAHIEGLLKQVGLKNTKRILKSYPHELSGGERQRIVIAMALAGNPELLIADEPTTALDSVTQKQILTLLKQLQKELDLAILFITHDIAVVRQIADKVYMMEAGKVLTDKLPQDEPFSAPTQISLSSPCVLDVQGLGISYGQHQVVKDFSLTVKQGETVALVGPSGCGKSSIAHALVRLVPATGKVYLDGQDFFALKGKSLQQARSKIQMVFQDPFSSLNPRWMIEDILLEGAKIHKIKNSQTLLSETLQKVHLNADILHRYPHELSGGQRVRVALARALMLKPNLLILDEITTALDIHTQAKIICLLKELQETQGLAYIFITHDERALKALAHRIILLT